jgi:BolA protein
MNLTEEIRSNLVILEPLVLNIQDDSAQHAGHPGNSGGGHFTVTIVSSHFCEKSQIIRHRLIYQQLEHLIPTKIHALSIHAIASNEYQP